MQFYRVSTYDARGIGLEIAHHIASKRPAKIILAVRNVETADVARGEILGRIPKGVTTIEVWKLDLADFSSVTAFAERSKGLERIDGVAMNAGILSGPTCEMTKDGHELVCVRLRPQAWDSY